MASRDAEDAGDETTAGRERKTSSAGTSAADEPPPFAPPALDTAQAPWHAYGDVAAWEPEFRALASALDRGRALGEWNLAFAHLRAGARRALARCRAEQYARFAALLERLAEPEPSRDDMLCDKPIICIPSHDNTRHAQPTQGNTPHWTNTHYQAMPMPPPLPTPKTITTARRYVRHTSRHHAAIHEHTPRQDPSRQCTPWQGTTGRSKPRRAPERADKAATR